MINAQVADVPARVLVLSVNVPKFQNALPMKGLLNQPFVVKAVDGLLADDALRLASIALAQESAFWLLQLCAPPSPPCQAHIPLPRYTVSHQPKIGSQCGPSQKRPWIMHRVRGTWEQSL
jgi:hypothetical protein